MSVGITRWEEKQQRLCYFTQNCERCIFSNMHVIYIYIKVSFQEPTVCRKLLLHFMEVTERHVERPKTCPSAPRTNSNYNKITVFQLRSFVNSLPVRVANCGCSGRKRKYSPSHLSV
jgi:hypothetical protein